jgi:hypothetical protein
MKKFKSLMLAALASAALAAPSFADGHEGPNFGITGISGEIIFGMRYATVTPDGGDTTTTQRTYLGDINAKLSSDHYSFQFEEDDEDADSNINFSAFGSATSGDNTISVSATIEDITNGNDASGLGDVYVVGSNKTLSVKAGKFGVGGYYYNGLGYYRASAGLTSSNQFIDDSEDLVILGNRGLQLGIDAGSVNFVLDVPFFDVAAGHDYSLTSSDAKTGGCAGAVVETKTGTYDKSGNATAVATTYTCAAGYSATAGTNAQLAKTNVSGIRPAISIDLGAGSLSAVAYSLNFAAPDGSDTVDKADSGVQIQGKMTAGSATLGLGFTSRTKKEGKTEVTPNVLNGSVVVALGGGQQVGASFDVITDGTEKDEATATRFSASYGMPFFVEAVTLKLGAGTATQSSDDKTKAGAASGLEAEWVYNF